MKSETIKFEAPTNFEFCIRIRVIQSNTCIGYATLIRKNNLATLADIFIHHHLMLKTHQNFRNQGIGTQLLNYVLHYCQAQGITRIEGVAKGDLEKLIPWYKKHGFTISTDNRIYREINI